MRSAQQLCATGWKNAVRFLAYSAIIQDGRIVRRKFLQNSGLATGTWFVTCFLSSIVRQVPTLPPTTVPASAATKQSVRAPFNSDIGLKPAVIAVCANEIQVATAVARARAERLSIAVKSRGHSFGGFSLNEAGWSLSSRGSHGPAFTRATPSCPALVLLWAMSSGFSCRRGGFYPLVPARAWAWAV